MVTLSGRDPLLQDISGMARSVLDCAVSEAPLTQGRDYIPQNPILCHSRLVWGAAEMVPHNPNHSYHGTRQVHSWAGPQED